MFLTLVTLATVAMYAAPPQSQPTEAPRPLVKLVDDLHNAMSQANLTETQRSHLQADSAALQAAREARDQGRPIDRQKVAAAVRDLKSVLDSNAFQSADKQVLLVDIQVLRSQR